MALIIDWAKIAAAHIEDPAARTCIACGRAFPCSAARMADRTLREMRELPRPETGPRELDREARS